MGGMGYTVALSRAGLPAGWEFASESAMEVSLNSDAQDPALELLIPEAWQRPAHLYFYQRQKASQSHTGKNCIGLKVPQVILMETQSVHILIYLENGLDLQRC